MSVGVFSITPFLIRRSLHASDFEVALLIAIWQAPWILAPFIEPLIARLHPQAAWRWMAVLAHAPLLAIAFLPMATPLMIVMGLYYLVGNAYVPHRGALIRTNYPPSVRGRMYSFIQAVTLLGAALAAKGAGWLMDGDDTFWVFEKLLAIVTAANKEYYQFEVNQFNAVQISKYEVGEYYHDHLDIGPGVLGNRKISLTLQLSDPDSYEGGDLVLDFTDFRASRQLGSITLFPSFIKHGVRPVTKGTRYSLVAWISGKDRFK